MPLQKVCHWHGIVGIRCKKMLILCVSPRNQGPVSACVVHKNLMHKLNELKVQMKEYTCMITQESDSK